MKNVSYLDLVSKQVQPQTNSEIAFEEKDAISSQLGKYKRFKLKKDPSFSRRHRCFISWVNRAISIIGKFLKTGRFVKPYLADKVVVQRNQLSIEDRKIMNGFAKIYGTKDGEKLSEEDQTALNGESYGDGWAGTSITHKIQLDSQATTSVIATILEDFKNDPSNMEKLYEVKLHTAIKGITTEPHACSIIIDAENEYIYCVDGKGVSLDKLFFYDHRAKSASAYTVADLIIALKKHEPFKEYAVAQTPHLQKVGDCVAFTETFSRVITVVRHLRAKQKTDESNDKEVNVALNSTDDCLQDFKAALKVVHLEYDKLITQGLRVQLEELMKPSKVTKKDTVVFDVLGNVVDNMEDEPSAGPQYSLDELEVFGVEDPDDRVKEGWRRFEVSEEDGSNVDDELFLPQTDMGGNIANVILDLPPM